MLSDFAFCLRTCAPHAAIYFRDAGPTRAAIAECLRGLRRKNRPCVAFKLPGDTFVVALGASPVGSDARVRAMAVAVNGKRWLWTASVSKSARRWVPAGLKPAFISLRERLWEAGR